MPAAPRWTLRRAGFTVTELLIACAVVATLVAILFPALQSFRGQSHSIRCLKNVSEIGRILLTYAADNGGIVVSPVILQPPNYTSGVTWNITLDELGLLKRETYSGLKNGVMSCPARPTAGSHVYNAMHYGINRNVGFDCIGFANRGPFKITRIENPSATMMLGEVKKDYMIQTTSDALMENIAYPHQMRSNVFFYDGHAESIPGPWARPVKGASYPFY